MHAKFGEYRDFIKAHVRDLLGKKILVVGDIGLDEYVFGAARRISPEAPVPVVEVENQEFRLGLAANVAQNISSLGGVPVLISVVGEDGSAGTLRQLLKKADVSSDDLIVCSDRPTTKKTRVIVQNHHIVRVDYEHRQFLPANVEAQVLKNVQKHIGSCAAVIVQDYAKGVLSQALIAAIVEVAHAHKKKVLADPNRVTPLEYYTGVDLMTPNYEESLALTKLEVDSHRPTPGVIDQVGKMLMKTVGAPEMVVTRGKEGMSLFTGGACVDMPTFARQVADVTGAGDTVIAAIALAWGSGFQIEYACALANMAAGVVVGKVGCVPCSTAELLEYIETF